MLQRGSIGCYKYMHKYKYRRSFWNIEEWYEMGLDGGWGLNCEGLYTEHRSLNNILLKINNGSAIA